MRLSEKILNLFSGLSIHEPLPKGVDVLNPYQDASTFKLCEQFYRKYYADNKERHLIMGINPGRLGGGLTGIPFTDPQKLETYCHIPNSLRKKSELSADFIYSLITAYEGPEKFYSDFYFSSVSPLGFIKDGKNLNYYDIPQLQSILKAFIVDCLKKQLDFGLNKDVCFILGEGKNFAFMQVLNKEFQFFNRLEPLPHPRFVMQYKRKKLPEYIAQYIHALHTI